MNRLIPKIGAAIVTLTVFLFAIFMIVDFPFGSYIVCMFLSIGYIMMTAGFLYESPEEQRVPANIGMVFSAIYAVLIFLVYFAQTTTVRLEDISEQVIKILDYQRGGLLFNYDLLGYGMLALSTFFIGISIKTESNLDKWLKCLMMIHGVFFVGCFVMPMTGVFTSMADGETGNAGTIALLFWCVYFIPIGVLTYKHFEKEK
jgi:FtsH-binding integral membrane protein